MSCQFYSQDIIVDIEVLDDSAEETAIGSTQWGMFTISDLKSVVEYCMSTSGQPVLDSCIQLKKNPMLKVAAMSRSRLNDIAYTQAILNKLISIFDLQIIQGEVMKTNTINVLAIQQKETDEKNGGTTIKDNGDWELHNMRFNAIITFFQRHNILVVSSDENFLNRKLTMLVSHDLLTDMHLKMEEVLELFEKSEVEVEMIMKPMVFITNLE